MGQPVAEECSVRSLTCLEAGPGGASTGVGWHVNILDGFLAITPRTASSPLAFVHRSSHNSSPCSPRLDRDQPCSSPEPPAESVVPSVRPWGRWDGMWGSTYAHHEQTAKLTASCRPIGMPPNMTCRSKRCRLYLDITQTKRGASCTQPVYARSAARLC